MTYISSYLEETKQIADQIDQDDIASVVAILRELRRRCGRLFILGNGGSAANASHAVNDFRKIAGIEAYAPSDHFAEISAYANDAEWQYAYGNWLRNSRWSTNDMLLVLSVGGGSEKISANLHVAMRAAHVQGIPIASIVSRDGGTAKRLSDVCVLVPVIRQTRITPHAEEWQSILLHLIVNALMEGE
jgi:D-sedoheptulose 7-phosphate isomerase